MNFSEAVKEYQSDPTKENLNSVCEKLRKELSTREKLRMISGRQFLLKNGYDLITKGQ